MDALPLARFQVHSRGGYVSKSLTQQLTPSIPMGFWGFIHPSTSKYPEDLASQALYRKVCYFMKVVSSFRAFGVMGRVVLHMR